MPIDPVRHEGARTVSSAEALYRNSQARYPGAELSIVIYHV